MAFEVFSGIEFYIDSDQTFYADDDDAYLYRPSVEPIFTRLAPDRYLERTNATW
jgi:hypothetical protein